MKITEAAKQRGFTVNLFLDPKTDTYVEEFATSNFAALTKADENGKRTYVTPKSKSILLSITNRSLTELAAQHFGWNVERRRIAWTEITAQHFEEIAACGTAVVITPINEIHREYVEEEPEIKLSTDIHTLWDDEDYLPEIKIEKFKSDNEEYKGFTQLYKLYKQIQKGETVDKFDWMYPREGIPRPAE